MARFENCTIEQYVEHMNVERMEVGTMTVEKQFVGGNTEIQNPRNTEIQNPDGLNPMISEDSLLAAHIKDREVRKKIIEALKSCKKNGQTAPMVEQILREHKVSSAEVITKPFCEALILYLPYNTTKEALYQAFYRL